MATGEFVRLSIIPSLLLLTTMGSIAAARDLELEDLIMASAPNDPVSLADMLEQIDAEAAELEANADVKCWTSLGESSRNL